jgi:mycothiol synthase
MLNSARDFARGLLRLGKKGNVQPQLLMWYPCSTPPAAPTLERGYRLRTYRNGDASAWSQLLNDCSELGVWSAARIEDELLGTLLPGGQFFATLDDDLVAGAGLYHGKKRAQACWEIGWVVTHPAHQGLGLGRQVTCAAVVAALAQPQRPIFIMTDDLRVPAVKLYLKMGFVPDFEHSSYHNRWTRLGRELSPRYKQIIDAHIEAGVSS